LAVLLFLVIFCPLGPTNFKKSRPYYILAKDALEFVFSHVPCKLYFWHKFCLVPVTCGCSFGEPLKQVIKMKWTYKQLYWSNLTCYWFRYIGFTVTDQELLQKKNNI
jgi:hypothetical protein